MDFFIYMLHWFFVGAALIVSWRRNRALLHPQFMFTVMICMLLSDFLIRGYDDKNIAQIEPARLYEYQLTIMIILAIVVFGTMIVRRPKLESLTYQANATLHVSPKARKIILLIALTLVFAELYKRFSTVEWSLDEVVWQSLMPRGQRDWDQAAYSGNFAFALATILLPFAGIAIAYLTSVGNAAMRLLSALAFSFILIILVTNGSRTPVVINLVALGLFWLLQQRNSYRRLVVIGIVGALAAITTSAMYLYRSQGYLTNSSGEQREMELTYHQDDSYYRALFAYEHADRNIEYWDPIFFITTILVNPIPRAIWPDKPIFDEQFYGRYKLYYVTNSFLGEVVAMTGVELSLFVSPLVGFLLYSILFNAQRLLKYPVGLAAYLIVALYTYMCIRSLPNLTHFMYLPIFSMIMVLLLGRMESRRRTRESTRLDLRASR